MFWKTKKQSKNLRSTKKLKNFLCRKHGADRYFLLIDRLLQDIVSVALYMLVFRIFFTFLFAFLMAQQWHIEWVSGWFPIIAFNADEEDFRVLNSYSIFATGGAVFLMFAHYVMSARIYARYFAWAWYIGVVMTLVQYLILLYLKDKINFGIREDLWIPFGILFVGATLMLLIRRKRLK